MERPKNYLLYHLHSYDSLLDSCTDFREYADLVKASGGTAIASTEHGLPRGWVSKKLYCDEIGLKFIHGVEMYLTKDPAARIRDNYHTVLLARNAEGVRELNQLVTLSSDRAHSYYTNRISFEEFCGISDNIIKTSACLTSPLNKLAEDDEWYERLVQHYDYLEVQPHDHPDQKLFNVRLVRLARKYGIPLIAGTDTHSSTPYKAECRSILLKAKGQSYGDEDSFDLTYKTTEELLAAFERQHVLSKSEIYEAVESTNALAELCEPFELDRSIKYPVLYGSPEKDEAVFEERCWTSLDEKLKNGVIPPEQEPGFRESIAEELRVFKKLGMSGFMLSMSDLVRWCKSEGMAIGTARGSVGGSRAAYVTDIIDLNPEQWKTVFSRFANEDREEIGDIDIDVVYDDRPRIFQYITERFGKNKTARVAAYGTLAGKSVIDEVCRALQIPLEEAKGIKRELDEADAAASEQGVPLTESTAFLKLTEKYPKILYYYKGLVGTHVSQSIHPAGMVISPIDLFSEYGAFLKDGEMCLLLDMDEAHEVGAAKYDFLALKTVKVIRDTCRYLGAEYPKTHEIDWNDQAVWADMCKDPTGIFQFESTFAAECFKKYKPQSIFDMSLVTACIRPTGTSYRDALLAHRPHKNPSELIDRLLENNLGYLVYQEDTIAFLQQICGLSGSEADNIRRAIGRKQKDRLEAALPSILEGYCEKSTQPREVAEQEAREFLQVIEDSASYQFGYNHSVAYCLLGYLCGYFRHYHPMEFITAFSNNAQNDDDIATGAKLMELYGLKIRDPKWGTSRSDFFFDRENGFIYRGLGSVKYMGAAVAEELYTLSQGREYTTFTDLLFAINDETSLDSRQLDILIKLDFFSDFGNQAELFRIVELYNLFKGGAAKQIKKERVDGTILEAVVKRHAVGTTKSGAEAKSYTLIDVPAILRESEGLVRAAGLPDISDLVKIQNYYDIMGTFGYTTDKNEDRTKLFVLDIHPLRRKKDNKQFGYSVITRSVGSGKETRWTVVDRYYNKDPIRPKDLIRVIPGGWERDGVYFRLTGWEHLYA